MVQSDKRRKAMEDKLGVTLEDNSELLSIINKDEEFFNIEKYKLNKLI